MLGDFQIWKNSIPNQTEFVQLKPSKWKGTNYQIAVRNNGGVSD